MIQLLLELLVDDIIDVAFQLIGLKLFATLLVNDHSSAYFLALPLALAARNLRITPESVD